MSSKQEIKMFTFYVTIGVCLILLIGQLNPTASQISITEPTLPPPSDTAGEHQTDFVITDGLGQESEPPDTSPSPPPPNDETLREDRGSQGWDNTALANLETQDASTLTLGGGYREGHFSANAIVLLPVSLNLRSYTSISFRTCRHGTLLSQIGSGGDTLELGVDEEGSLVLNLNHHSQDHVTSLGRGLNDNAWHRVYLRFELGILRLGVDELTVVVANLTSSASLIDLGLWSPSPQLTIGGNFTGCILQGAGTELTNPLAKHTGVEWGVCPLPDGTDCSGYDEDHCFSQPCRRRGECVALQDGYMCNCYTRYSGEECEEDSGPLCNRSEYFCLNGGMCQEDRQGNTTYCACPIGYTGSICEVVIDDTFCEDINNPCQNNATCTVTTFSDTYECQCPPGFSGDHCEVNDDDCASQPCWHGGTCNDLVNSFECQCEGTGYEGDICQTNIDECLSSSCTNGATCFDLYGDYECACTPGYAGKHCEMEVRECSSNPCQNGGTCEDLQNGYRCTCMLGFEGDNCEHNIDDCYNVTACPLNSFCMDLTSGYVCRCNLGFSGTPPDCLEINECDSSPCMNGATCYDQENSFTCICPSGYSGHNCEINVDDCSSNPCQNGATCEDGIDSYTCVCSQGFEGDFCEENIDECTMNYCIHSRNCIDLFGDYECECEDGWAGKNCEEEVDECSSSPCLNGSTCEDRLNGFSCVCLPGFSGELCSTDIDDCEVNPCMNGGFCIDGLNNYTCHCGDAFMGTNCEEEYDACSSNPCQNGAFCNAVKGQQEFYCECIPGFEGIFCSINIDDCFSGSCTDGKVCFDLVNNYECRCPEGFTGENCTIDINECESNPCLNDGECLDGLANYTCVCPAGYTGHNCEEDIDECEMGPCIHGICQNTNGSYQCYCRPGFSGDHCNLEFDECLSLPCRNGGSCINMINGYECVCQPGYTGTDCDTDIDECASAPCQNNATCYDGIANFTCECLPGFTDQLCSTNIDECESEPCMNGGACSDGINNYTCNCIDTGFKGDQCQINIDDCESSPCQHGSTCSDLIKDYNCLCYDGYKGKNCEEDIAECEMLPCQNGATCLERSNLTLYEYNIFSNFSYAAAGGFICQCLPGFMGDYCEINIDECASSPCINGECIDGINAYSCQCLPGYEGVNCEIEINECELYMPCVYGTCTDKVADYKCDCDDDFGGKNCSVQLLGCIDVDCYNAGVCEALLYQEITHDYICHCEHGFTGRNCENSTTLSLSGNSYVLINSPQKEGYELEFRFRTTLANGILAVGQGETFIKLELLNGQLNLHSSLLNKWEGIFLGSDLNDGQWQDVQLFVNDSHAALAVNDKSTIHPINPVQTINSVNTSFSATVLGGATPTLTILSKGAPFFTGCMEDVFVDGEILIPSSVPSPMKVSVEEGCPRVEQCSPNPCKNEGECQDLWTNFQCNCKRPYLGDTCQLSFTPATFGNENVLDSLVTVVIPEVDHSTYRTHADVSMLVRTREPDGLIFYLGTPLDNNAQGVRDTHLLAQLVSGDLVLRIMLDGPEETFTITDLILTDGEPHLLHVQRINSDVAVYVDNILVLNTSLVYGGSLDAQVLYLGGIPDDPSSRNSDGTLSRTRRQLGVSNFTTTVTRPHFKGTLQDIRLSNGTETRLIQPFPLQNITDNVLPGEDLDDVQNHNVLEGTVSDNTCDVQPCRNGATCSVTWNDFNCTCTFGYKGKTCEEREYCALYQCPAGAECINLNDGYECAANLTLNGVNSSLLFSPSLSSPLSQMTDVIVNYRSQVGGIVFWASFLDATVWIGMTQNTVVVHQTNGSATRNTYFSSNVTLDGNWHTLKVTFDPTGLQVLMDDSSLMGTDIAVIVDLTAIAQYGEVMVGSSPDTLSSLSLLDPSLVVSTSAPENALVPEELSVPRVFRGCVGIIRIQEILLPFFSQADLINNTAANQFLRRDESNTETGCTVCFNEECVNDGYCSDPAEVYSCTCHVGFEGNLCEINIDECVAHQCLNGATCVDGVNAYTCACMPGYTGEFCSEDIDECATSPCKNGGICQNEIAQFICQCPEDFIGTTCEELRVKNCSKSKCQNGATCNDIYNPLTDIADNYTCSCPYGFSGYNCENIIDYCTLKSVLCDNGGSCSLTYKDEGWRCDCKAGWEGLTCEREIDECASEPCKNGGVCYDNFNAFTCNCTDSWEGGTCEDDVNECLDTNKCNNGGDCINLQGSFECSCSDKYCGQTCNLINPCSSHNCSNGGECIHLCDEFFPVEENKTRAECLCQEGWGGDQCLDEVVVFPTDIELAIIVGCVVGLMLIIAIVGLTVFLMMAKKKRQTRGTYSPSRQEFYSPRVEMGNIMKPPPEERLI